MCIHKSLQSCPTLRETMDCNLPGSSVHRKKILEWVAMPSSRGSFPPRDQTHVSCIGRWVLYHQHHLESLKKQTIVFKSESLTHFKFSKMHIFIMSIIQKCSNLENPVIPILNIYPKETKIQKDTCTPMFPAMLFTIARTLKQSRCP